jgi:excisionase family DNA binding protein
VGGHILTIKEVAGYLKIKERTIYRLSQAKKIPSFKVGGMWWYSQTASTVGSGNSR